MSARFDQDEFKFDRASSAPGKWQRSIKSELTDTQTAVAQAQLPEELREGSLAKGLLIASGLSLPFWTGIAFALAALL